MTLQPWVLAARPKTLSAAVVPVLIGTALAPRPVDWRIFAFTLLGALLIQIGTNYVNDAIDFRKGADSGERLGPVRVTQAGLLSAEAMLRGAYACFFLAALCGVPLIVRAGWPLLIIGLTSIAAAYAYTGGPYPLAYHGLGEIFVILFFGFVAVGGTLYVQALEIDPVIWPAGFAAGSLATVLLVINNLRDEPNDRESGKKTLAVRFGPRFARAEVVLFTILPYASLAAVAAIRGSWLLLLPLLVVPFAALVIACALRHSGRDLNRCLALAGAQQWAFGIVFVIGTLV